MKNSTNKEIIIGALLESPKTNGELAIKCGYVDGKYGDYHNIGKDLTTLEQYGYIHRIPAITKRPGRPATWYDIVYKKTSLKEMWDNYPNLCVYIQKSDKSRSMLTEDHIWLFPLSKENAKGEDIFAEINKMAKAEFKNRLKESLSFFKFFLMNEQPMIEKTFQDVLPLSSKGRAWEYVAQRHALETKYGLLQFSHYTTAMLEIFKISVGNDILEGNKTPEAIKTVMQLEPREIKDLIFDAFNRKMEKEYMEGINFFSKQEEILK